MALPGTSNDSSHGQGSLYILDIYLHIYGPLMIPYNTIEQIPFCKASVEDHDPPDRPLSVRCLSAVRPFSAQGRPKVVIL